MDVPAPDRRGERGQQLPPKKESAEDDFWVDVACAFGGRSIAEWQAAISEEERSQILNWIRRHGPINPAKRFDALFAHLSSTVMNANDRKKQGGVAFTLDDMRLTWAQPEEPDATPEAVMALLRSKRKG